MTVKPLEEVVYEAIMNAIRTFPTKQQAAHALGISDKTLYNKIEKYRQLGRKVQ